MEKENYPTCYRCGNRLALGMAIVTIVTMIDSQEVKLCGACQSWLKGWLKPRPNRAA